MKYKSKSTLPIEMQTKINTANRNANQNQHCQIETMFFKIKAAQLKCKSKSTLAIEMQIKMNIAELKCNKSILTLPN